MPRDTGFPTSDAQFDFSRARRRRALSRLANRVRGEPGDVMAILPFEEVVEALGRRGERNLGLQTIEIDSIVGTVDRSREFDRSFRPTSGRVRTRWERIAEAQRRGQPMPPIHVYRIGDLHFVKDGHHRVSVARAMGQDKIDAYVTEVITEVDPEQGIRLADLPLKSHERLFFERVPLPPEAQAAHPPQQWRRLRVPGGGRGGLGLPAHAGPRPVHDSRGGGAGLVARGVPAGGRDAPRGRDRQRRQRDRRLRGHGLTALPAAAHSRMGRRGPRAVAPRDEEPDVGGDHGGPPPQEGTEPSGPAIA